MDKMAKKKPSHQNTSSSYHADPRFLEKIDNEVRDLSQRTSLLDLSEELVSQIEARKKEFDDATVECRAQEELICPLLILSGYCIGPVGRKFTFNMANDIYVDDEVIGLKKRYRGRTLSIQARRQKELPIQIGKHIINHQQQEEIVWYDLPFLFPPAKKIRQSIFSLIKNPKINQIIREVIDQKKTIEDYKRELYAYFYSVLKKKFDASPEPIIEWVENWLQEQFGNMEGEIHTSGYVPPTVVKNI